MIGSVQLFSKAPRNGQITRVATSAVVAKIDLTTTVIYNSANGKFAGRIRLRANAFGAQFYFAPDNTGTVVVDSVIAGQMGWELPAGQAEDYDITPNDKFLIIIARGAGFIDIMRSGQENIGNR